MKNLTLEVGTERFRGLFFDNESKQIVLAWLAETEVSNIFWERLLTFKWGWPPWKMAACFRED